MASNVTAERRKMMLELFEAIDSKNVDGLLSFLAPEATQTFGNQEPLRGHDEIRAGNLAFFGMIDRISHEVVDLWEWDGVIVAQLKATYGRADGRSVTLPAVTVLKESVGLIAEYQVYVDHAPVLALVGH
jgi:ketosteroid isomerase-like protein